ncbi:hydroxysqualene dehydroxylase HpnE [Iodidimonas nitroreducens]|nr:hydroxysqualene dehydroxylase HpnE [Iodidimonas nitroreducens]
MDRRQNRLGRPIMAHIHIIGAGLAGLAAAVRLIDNGHQITLYEAAARAGGRCRSFHDEQLGLLIDNGNHLMLSGNRSLHAYLDEIGGRDPISGAMDQLIGPNEARFPFFDLESGERWTFALDKGLWQGWVFDRKRRIPGSRPRDYLSALSLLMARKSECITDRLSVNHPLYRRLWEPLVVAVLNCAPADGSAHLLRRVLRESFARGGAYCQPRMARLSLAHCLIDPALEKLQKAGATIRFHSRINRLDLADGRLQALSLGDELIPLGAEDQAICATPAPIARTLLPDLSTPPDGEAIVNIHFRLPAKAVHPEQDGASVEIIGLVGGLSQWIFLRDELASVTISAANAVARRPADEIARICWGEVSRALQLGDQPLPPFRVIKEKRATFAASPEAEALRPKAATQWANLILAGDWTATGLPSTIEGAIRSGHKAAHICLQKSRAFQQHKPPLNNQHRYSAGSGHQHQLKSKAE